MQNSNSSSGATPAADNGNTVEAGGDVAGSPAIPDMTLDDSGAAAPAPSTSLSGLQAWANAIMKFEGGNPWNLNMRNNNPGNLKVTDYSGQVGNDSQGFAIFDSLQSGMNALIADLQAAVQKYPDFSLVQFQTHYLGGDPFNIPAEGQPVVVNGKNQGNPWDYANFVAQKLGVSANDTLSSIFGG